MKFKKSIVLLLILALSMGGIGQFTLAKAATSNIELISGTDTMYVMEPGETMHFKVPIKAVYAYIDSPEVSISTDTDAPFTTGLVTLSRDNYAAAPTNITVYETTYVEFDVVMKDTASIGKYPLNLTLTYYSYTVSGSEGTPTEVTETIALKLNVLEEKMPAQITVSDVSYNADDVVAGKTFDLSFDVNNEGEIAAYNTYVSVAFGDSSMVAGYSVENIKLGTFLAGASQTVTLPLTVLPTAEAGFKTLTLQFTYKDSDGKESTAQRSVYVTIKDIKDVESGASKLELQGDDFNTKVTVGKDTSLTVEIKNTGKETAKDITIIAADGVGSATGIVPMYTTDGISVGDLAAGKDTSVTIPFMIADNAATGLREITVKATYTDNDNIVKTANLTLYLTIESIENSDDKTVTEVIIKNVVQNPSVPVAGSQFTVTFDMVNNGNKAITNVKIAGTNLSKAGFEPVSSEPYQLVGDIAAGEKKTVTMKFNVGADIPAGLNALTLAYSYNDADKVAHDETAALYILNVQNTKEELDTGKPKLIISDYTTDETQLTAGSTFNFTFTIKNTNEVKAAKNIKVTLSQADNVFSATQGSNSFYISSIGPEEESINTMNLKVRSDATTGTYDLKILVEYEYDDMSQTDKDNGGVSESNSIKLTAVENARPVVQNISAYDSYTYSSPTVNSNCMLTFEFYNMGRSALNNVYATIEGDFSLATGTMYYIGTVGAGSAEYAELEAIPLIEGDAVCNIVIHFEDSNGDEVTRTTEYTTTVMGATNWDDGGSVDYPDDGGYVDPGVDTGVAKDPILPTWLFIVLEVVAFAVVILVVRGVMLVVYKSKLRKKLEAEEKDSL